MGLFLGLIVFIIACCCLGFFISHLSNKNSELQKNLDEAERKIQELHGKIKNLEMLTESKNK